MRRAVALLAAASVAAGCAGTGSSEGTRPAVPVRSGAPGHPLFGFNDNSIRAGQTTPDREAALVAGSGGRVLRLAVDWRSAEPAPGRYDLVIYDQIYAALRSRAVRPLWIVFSAPPWAWDPGTRCPGACALPPSAAAEPRFDAFVQEIARRYPESAGIEIWNEPNLVQFWQPRPDPARYARLLKRAYRAVKRVSPQMPVVNGGLSNNKASDDKGNVSLRDFLETMYAHGAGRSTDAISFHAYPVSRSAPELLRSVADVLVVLRARHDTRKRLWITELGATTTGLNPDLRWTPKAAARTLRSDYCRLARVPTVRMVLIHTLVAPRGAQSNPETGYGLVAPDGSLTPAYRTLRRTVERRDPC